MKGLFTLLLSLPVLAFAQTTHVVDVFGGGAGNPAPAYAPQNLTIDVGDIVEWNNTQGSHNVWGDQSTFPSNPESFSSGQPAFAPWTFSHTFTIAGVYDYHCTQGNHAQTQFGTVTVVATPGIVENESKHGIKLFPNPVSDVLNIEIEGAMATQFQIFSVDGRTAMQFNATENGLTTLVVDELQNGQYVLRSLMQDGTFRQQRFVVSRN